MLQLGPQSAGDDTFTARMRLHQSWYRAAVLRREPGVGPKAKSTTTYGNMLPAEAGERGENFLRPDIASLALARQRENPAGIERHRLLCNMLSSQPMAFNLFGPAALDAELAPRFVSAMLDGRILARVTGVVFEHAPAPKADYLDDATSFDVFFEVVDDGGRTGFVAVETKLTEPFSQKRYGIEDRPAYRQWLDRPASPWAGVEAARLESPRHNQLFRNHALAYALACVRASSYAFGYSVVVHHAGDAKCQASVAGYRELITRPEALPFLVRPLDELVARLRPVVQGTPHDAWLDDFDARYVTLDGSGPTPRTPAR